MCHVMDKGEFKMEDFSQKVNELRVSELVRVIMCVLWNV